jgi:cephalosporin hydroxylase
MRAALRRGVDQLRAPFDSLVMREYEKLYYRNLYNTWKNTRWMGHRVWKATTDLWVYQELLYTVRPDLILETGTAEGGSAYYLASLLDIIGRGRIITIDVETREGRPTHPRIEYVLGSSVSADVVAIARDAARGASAVMGILDSDHSQQHVLKELDAFGPLITPGSYLIVEDTNVNGHPVFHRHGPGPSEALRDWLPTHPEFLVDRECERFYNTFNPGGYLKKIAAEGTGIASS